MEYSMKSPGLILSQGNPDAPLETSVRDHTVSADVTVEFCNSIGKCEHK